MHNKFLLWQGIKPMSLASTLQDGVRMPAVESAMTGYMFGKGIYFTDCFSKAALNSLGQQKKTG
jgi:poly [ADP-ribose] polymerase 2/3/4